MAKYAEATEAVVALGRQNGSLTFVVSDDGGGFDPSATGYGTGLQGIADRLGALDGELSVVELTGRRDDARGPPAGRGDRPVSGDTARPKGMRRLERWFVGLIFAIIAFVLEKIVMRSVRARGGSTETEEVPTTLTSKGGMVELEEGDL